MNKISIDDAFKAEGLDANAVKVEGFPERHIEAIIAYGKLITGADHVDGDGELDYTDYSQPKYSAYAKMGSPSGRGFSCHGYARWAADSDVGARLSFKKSEAAEWFFKKNKDLYKTMMVYRRKLK